MKIRRPGQRLRRLAAGRQVHPIVFGAPIIRRFDGDQLLAGAPGKVLGGFFPAASIWIVNAGVDGNTAADGLARLGDVVPFRARDQVLTPCGPATLDQDVRMPGSAAADLSGGRRGRPKKPPEKGAGFDPAGRRISFGPRS